MATRPVELGAKSLHGIGDYFRNYEKYEFTFLLELMMVESCDASISHPLHNIT